MPVTLTNHLCLMRCCPNNKIELVHWGVRVSASSMWSSRRASPPAQTGRTCNADFLVQPQDLSLLRQVAAHMYQAEELGSVLTCEMLFLVVNIFLMFLNTLRRIEREGCLAFRLWSLTVVSSMNSVCVVLPGKSTWVSCMFNTSPWFVCWYFMWGCVQV